MININFIDSPHFGKDKRIKSKYQSTDKEMNITNKDTVGIKQDEMGIVKRTRKNQW